MLPHPRLHVQLAVGHQPHQVDAATGPVVLVAQLGVCGTGGRAQSAMHAIEKQLVADFRAGFWGFTMRPMFEILLAHASSKMNRPGLSTPWGSNCRLRMCITAAASPAASPRLRGPRATARRETTRRPCFPRPRPHKGEHGVPTRPGVVGRAPSGSRTWSTPLPACAWIAVPSANRNNSPATAAVAEGFTQNSARGTGRPRWARDRMPRQADPNVERPPGRTPRPAPRRSATATTRSVGGACRRLPRGRPRSRPPGVPRPRPIARQAAGRSRDAGPMSSSMATGRRLRAGLVRRATVRPAEIGHVAGHQREASNGGGPSASVGSPRPACPRSR